MRVVIQRVSQASVEVDAAVVGQIGKGLLLFVGVGQDDTDADIDWFVRRLIKLRVWEDEGGRMSRSLMDVDGEVLVISQFTLFGSLKKGNRPSFNRAALPDMAVPVYERFIEKLSDALGKAVPTGVFGAHMDIKASNDGPVTLIVDSRDKDF